MIKSPVKFARNVDALMLHLGIKKTPANRQQVATWTLHPSFPKKQLPNGWLISEARKWYENNGALIKELAATKKKKAKETSPRPSPSPGAMTHGRVENSIQSRTGIAITGKAENAGAAHKFSTSQTDIPSHGQERVRVRPGELPPQDNPAGGELFDSQEDQFKKRLDHLEDLYLHPDKFPYKIAVWEVKELREHRPEIWAKNQIVPAPTSGTQDEDKITGLPKLATFSDLAVILSHHYHGKIRIKIDKNCISQWRNGERLTFGDFRAPPPPGTINARGDVSPQQWIAWFDDNLFRFHCITGQAELGYDVHEKFVKRVEQKELQVREMEADTILGKYLPIAPLENFLEGAAAQYTAHFDRLIEDKDGVRREVQEVLSELGLSAEQKLLADAKMVPRCIARNDALKAQFQQIGEELEKKIQELKKPVE